jgi:hypothetical protein
MRPVKVTLLWSGYPASEPIVVGNNWIFSGKGFDQRRIRTTYSMSMDIYSGIIAKCAYYLTIIYGACEYYLRTRRPDHLAVIADCFGIILT